MARRRETVPPRQSCEPRRLGRTTICPASCPLEEYRPYSKTQQETQNNLIDIGQLHGMTGFAAQHGTARPYSMSSQPQAYFGRPTYVSVAPQHSVRTATCERGANAFATASGRGRFVLGASGPYPIDSRLQRAPRTVVR